MDYKWEILPAMAAGQGYQGYSENLLFILLDSIQLTSSLWELNQYEMTYTASQKFLSTLQYSFF